MKYISAFITFLTLCTASQAATPVTRAAFDLGSGRTKLTVANVDVETGAILDVHHASSQRVLLGNDFKRSIDGSLSPEILMQLRQALVELKGIAEEMGAVECCGVATAVFRESSNGREVVERLARELGFDLRVISQEEEGVVGFHTAVVASGMHPQQVISWDSGSASFQISALTSDGLSTFKGPLGTAKALSAMVAEIRNEVFSRESSANPATLDEVRQLVTLMQERIPDVPEWLEGALADNRRCVVGIGEGNGFFGAVHTLTGKRCFNKEHVWEVIETCISKSDDELSQWIEAPQALIAELALLYAVMDHLDVDHVHFRWANGGTPAILTLPHFWTLFQAPYIAKK